MRGKISPGGRRRERRNWPSADVLKHSETRELPYSPDQMFDLVSDIGSYAQFLPWVVGVRIRSRTAQEILADLLVGFGPLRDKFTSSVPLARPGSIEVENSKWPRKNMQTVKRFR